MKNLKKLTLLTIMSIFSSAAYSCDFLSTARMIMENNSIYFSTAFSQKGLHQAATAAQSSARRTYQAVKPHTSLAFGATKALAFEAATRTQKHATLLALDAYEGISHRIQTAQDKVSRTIRTAAQQAVDRAIQATKEAADRTADTLTGAIESSSESIVTSTKEAAQSATARIKDAKSAMGTTPQAPENSIAKSLSFWLPKK